MLRYRAMAVTRIHLFILLCTSVEADVGKHIFIDDMVEDWDAAQSYCRQHYTDLSMVYRPRDQDKIKEAAGGSYRGGWIGLYKDSSGSWKWSIGQAVDYDNWSGGQPDNNCDNEDTVEIRSSGKWNDQNRGSQRNFYCFNITVVNKRSTWEEALEHCRETDTDLASVLFDTDRHLAQNEMEQIQITDPVWIGLRFLGDRWMWTNGDSLEYEDWPQGGDHQCPAQKRCGALTAAKQWVNLDCLDELPFICV